MASVPALLDAAAASSRGRGGGGLRRGGGPRRREGDGESRPTRTSNERQPPKRRNLEAVAEDETGIIESLMEGFGFIRCADRDTSLFFHFSEMKDHTRQPEVGDELQFAIVRDKDERRERAARVEVLPKGTVVFEVVEKSNLTGVVTAPLQFNKAKRKEGFGGRITLIPTTSTTTITTTTMTTTTTPTDNNNHGNSNNNGNNNNDNNNNTNNDSSNNTQANNDTKTEQVEVYEFSERDVVDTRVPLREGDEVEFDLFIEKRTGQTGATRISLIKPCPAGRIRGVVNNVVTGSNFGFIDIEDEDRLVYFPLAELLDAKANVVEGTELEFAMVKDRNGKDRAVSITVLPPGTVKVWKVSTGNKLEGVVTTELPVASQRGSGKAKGTIEVTNEDGSKESVVFTIDDIHMKTRKRLLKGDGVKLRVATRGASEPKRGRDIELVRETETDREKGIIVPTKPNSDRIYISCENRRNHITMALSEVPCEMSSQLKPGTEIEFTVVSEGPARQPIAIRPKELPKGSVVLVEIGTEVLEGVVFKELSQKKMNFNRPSNVHNYEPPKGLIKVVGGGEDVKEQKKSGSGSNGSVQQYAYGENDMAEDEKVGTNNLFQGDKVKFRLKLDKQTKRQSATLIQLVGLNDKRSTGVVTKDSVPSGKVMSNSPGEQIHFALNSVLDPNQPLQVGDCVGFDMRKDGTGKPYVARLSRLPPGSVVVEEMSTLVKGVVDSVGKEGGTIAVEGEGQSHPGALGVPILSKTEHYHSDRVHPATLYLARGRNATLSFWNDDARPEGRSLTLSKGDAVNLVICSHVADPMCRRAVQITTRPKSSKKPVVTSTRRSIGPGSGGFTFLRTSQIEAIVHGKAMPGDGTDEETDESGDLLGSKAED